jgi:AcrR family transcriptional regulator
MSRRGDLKRQQIVATANDLFYHRGFHQTSLADIAAACGVPKGNFYFHFRTKDDILKAVAEGRAERYRERLEAWEREWPHPLDRLLRLSEMIVRDWSDIVRFGCPVGTLVQEVGKQADAPKKQTLCPFEMILAWATVQFEAIAGPANARKLARQLLVRMQGASVLANAFDDETWLFDEQRAIAEWLEGLTSR